MPDKQVSDYLTFLQDIEAHCSGCYLEGGQAVNFWAEYFSAKGSAKKLNPYKPFTSKDCDLWADSGALKYLSTIKDVGLLIRGSSPADGQTGIFKIKSKPRIVREGKGNAWWHAVPNGLFRQVLAHLPYEATSSDSLSGYMLQGLLGDSDRPLGVLFASVL